MILTTQLHQLFQSESLSALIANARTLLSNPIILTDLNHHVLEMSEEPDLQDSKWLHIKETRIVDATHNVSDIYHRSLFLQKPLLNKDIMDTVDVMRMAVAHNDQLIGFLEIPCFYAIPNQEEQELIKFVADIACLIMKRDMGYLHAPSDEKYFFIHDLIEGRILDEKTCKARSSSLHWNVSDHYRVLTLLPKDSLEHTKKASLSQLQKNLEKKIPKITAFLYGDTLKAVVPVNEDTIIDGQFFADIMEFLKKENLEAGISKSTDRLIDMKDANIASEKALYYGRLLKSDEILFFYNKYSIYHVLECCDEHIDIMQFCHSAIIKLANYDRIHQTDLLATMRTFLYSGQNIAESAAKLFIHRNTLNNRLQKIDDLIHVELQDSESVFHLMLSYHILEYIGANKIYDYETRITNNPQLKHQ